MSHPLPAFGIDKLLQDRALLFSLSQKNVGLITNQSALTQHYAPTAFALKKGLGRALKCILTPEHGWSGLVGEGVHIHDGFDPHLDLPILSLYGKNKNFLEFIQKNHINTILIDLQDIGLRCYTYTATCAKFLEACVGLPLEIIVCDRPNPLGPLRTGPALDSHYRTLLAYLDIPFQHGKTIGQLLSSFNDSLGEKSFSFQVIESPLSHQPFHYPWIPPSPNLPSWESALLYPALVLLEGTNISEGRGTTLPFTCLGASGLNHYQLVDFVNNLEPGNVRARPITFTPQSGKNKGQECQGVHLLLTDPQTLKSLSLGITIIHFLKENYPQFEWIKVPSSILEVQGEERYFIDYLLGTSVLRTSIDEGMSLSQVLTSLSSAG
jgi:uncharacterized protein YbbC (DUF1343 family)